MPHFSQTNAILCHQQIPQLAREKVDIYILTAPGSSGQAREFLMRKAMVFRNKYLTTGNFQKRFKHF
jgi:hypothetical protein